MTESKIPISTYRHKGDNDIFLCYKKPLTSSEGNGILNIKAFLLFCFILFLVYHITVYLFCQ